MNILVLTTEQNFVWTSMQEIIPSIVHNWQSLESDDYKVDVLNVDGLELKRDGAKFLKAEVLVVTAFNLDIHKALKLANEVFHFEGKTYFYLHNFSTIACWPLHKWDALKYFRSSDVFVSSCSRDQVLCKKLFPKNTCLNIPFLLEQEIEKEKSESEGPFVFIGRLSEQKNLHTLLVAYEKYTRASDVKRKLVFYGKEDQLGSPNMGKASGEYLLFLKETVTELKLEELIEFRGFVPREKIYSELSGKDYIFVSPSMHSDENFGMAAFKSLCDGKRVLLSDWGGHSEYEKFFENQLVLLKVDACAAGPMTSVEKTTAALLEVEKKKSREPHLPEYFSEKSIVLAIKESLRELERGEVLEASNLVMDVIANREKFLTAGSENTSTKIFSGYSDPLAKVFLSAYGMGEVQDVQVYKKSHYRGYPWCKIEGSQLVVNDPHLGKRSFELESGPAIALIGSQEKRISYELVKTLLDNNGLYMDGTTSLSGKLFPDKCQTSIDLLKVRVQSFFEKNNLRKPQFADDYLNFKDTESKEIENIVLFGGYMNRVLESGTWPFKKVKFWVISESVKNCLCEIYKFKPEQIGVIPRYEIFDKAQKSSWPSIENAEFVYAGRISRVKNISQLILTYHKLQTKFKNISLILRGDFDSETHDYDGVFTVNSYREELETLIKELEWNSEPVFANKLAHDEWPRALNKNSVYLSFSTYLSEDYAVSIAQAQEAGIPIIASDWGGHQEVSGAVLKIPSQLFFPRGEEELLSKLTGQYIEKHWGMSLPDNGEEPLKLPTEVSISELDELRRDFCQKYGSQVLGLTKGMGAHFAESDEGKLLYNKWVKSLGKMGIFKTWVVLKKDRKPEDLAHLEGLVEYGLMHSTELSHGDNLKRLCLAEKVILLLDEKESKKIGELLKGLIGEDRVSTPLVK